MHPVSCPTQTRVSPIPFTHQYHSPLTTHPSLPFPSLSPPVSKFITSKFRNTRLKTYKSEEQYNDLRINVGVTPESNGIKASSEYVVVHWDTKVGGSLAAIPVANVGRIGRDLKLINAHSAKICDFDLSPHIGTLLATGADDGLIKIFNLPGGVIEEDVSEATVALEGHTKKLTNVLFNPTAANVLASTSFDKTLRLWDVEKGIEMLNVSDAHPDKIHSMAWNYNGSLLATTCADKKMRIVDPRAGTVVQEVDGHAGTKQTRVIWLGDTNKLVSTGFSKFRDRQFLLWDFDALEKPLATNNLDTSTGVLMPLYDPDTSLLITAGKGDNRVSLFDIMDKKPWQIAITAEASRDTQTGIALMPKLNCDHMNGEVGRVLKLTKTGVEPIMMQVPRKSYRQFHDDLFPPTAAFQAAIDADQWFAGESADPIKVDIPDPSNGSSASESSSSTENQSSSSSNNEKSSSSSGNSSSESSSSSASGNTEIKIDAKYETYASKQLGSSANSDNKRFSAQALKAQNIVRKSFFRHINGKAARNDEAFEGLKISTSNSPESNGIKVNKHFVAVPWAGGGGQLGVFPIDNPHRLPNGVPVIAAHSAPVTDFDFNPFNDHMIATGSEDAHIKIWNLPTGGLTDQNLVDPALDLQGHQRRVGIVRFHPLASDLLFSTSNDSSMKVWDLEVGDTRCNIEFSDNWDSDAVVYSMDFNYTGSNVVTACKDKVMRYVDPRNEGVALEIPKLHDGSKGVKVCWAGKSDSQFISIGYNRSSERQMRLWDIKSPDKPLASLDMDVGAGIMMPFYDEDINVLYMGGAGEGIIRMYEILDGKIHYLNSYNDSNNPQSGLAIMPKSHNNVKNVEIATIYKLTVRDIRPVVFTVPRTRTEFFQDDIYPDTRSGEPTLTGGEWLENMDVPPQYVSLQPEGMEKLSSAPAENKKTGKYSFEEEMARQQGEAKELTRDAVFDKLYSQVQTAADEEFVPGADLEGVDDDEWDDSDDDW
eukprot:TRINITY_DN2212_c0_g1_i2.p1 TRINITY_DN2212_c0_g1~~TRINITY_DN2212_c0_g1_i2.p1  ORF type:complete len:989 (+),score=333.46 TRINITY_DN2212_c0_g1_i2:624-3590(+)